MNGDLVCPACRVPLAERTLVTTTSTIESCPYCRTVVRQQEGFRWENRDALILEDVSAVEAWLNALSQDGPLSFTRRSEEDPKGEYRWDATGVEVAGNPLPWLCSVEYEPSTPNVCELRLTSDEGGEAVTAEPEWLPAVCADHGVQAHGTRSMHSDGEGQRLVVRWGVCQLLATRTLPESLFRAVVRRLDQAMRDATTRLGQGRRPES